ncbi:MAG: hypothetical protein IKO99_09965 [Bacteroidales bacterium]|nr:hypothetical protein [Bacteroidales bacterium]
MDKYRKYMNQCFFKRGIPAIIVFVVIFYLLFSDYPYVFDRLVSLPSIFVNFIFAVIILIILILGGKRKIRLPNLLIQCIVFQIIIWFFYAYFHSDTSYIVRILFLFVVFLSMIAIKKYSTIKRFVKLNNLLIAFQAIFCFVAFTLILSGILHPLLEVTNVDNRKLYFFGISCTNDFNEINFARLSGFFDEPGALAFWGIYSLIFNKLFTNNKKIELLLVVGLLGTLSLAYFVQLFVYFVLFYYDKLKVFIPIILLLSIGIFIAASNNDRIREFTIERISNFSFSNNNRSKPSEIAKEYFKMHPIFGNGAKKIEKTKYMGDNPYELLAKDGILGMLITYLPLLWCGLSLRTYRKRKVLFGIFILMLGYMQRPFHVNMMHYMMLFSFMYMTLKYYNSRYYYVSK